MNCLLPRAATIKSFTEKQVKLVAQAQDDEKPKSFTEVFIPELCIKYEFPGVFWYKAFMLPSLLHRYRPNSLYTMNKDFRLKLNSNNERLDFYIQ